MDPQAFVNMAENSGTPAPMWFIEFFKVLGFVLHSIPMNLWYAGLIIAVALMAFGGENARRFGSRLVRQMPIIIAFGVNLGVVPLLFTQLAYYNYFYPTTIFMAWFWLSIIGLLIVAYYGVYAYVWGLKNGENLARWRRLAGWAAAICFLSIGFIFANALSLMEHLQRWLDLWNDHQIAGAALGTALNVGDRSLWPRWLMMFGLAQTTTAVWVLADMAFFFKNASEDYKNWAWRFAKKLYTHGMIWTVLAGTWYVFGTWSPELRWAMFSWPMIVLTAITGAATGLPWLLIVSQKRFTAKLPLVIGIALAQFGVMAVNGISRQIAQNLNLNFNVQALGVEKFSHLDQLAKSDVTQWGPLFMFLIVFVIGLAVVAWMIRQVIVETRKSGV
jgi:hypothetical protein